MTSKKGFILFASLLFLLSSCTERRQYRILENADKLQEEKNYTEAIKLYRKVYTMDAESRPAIKAYYRLGFIQETYLKNYDGALLSYLEFMKYNHDSVSRYEVQKRIANLYFSHLLDAEQARSSYEKLLDMSPESLEADQFYFRLGQSNFRLNDFASARKRLQELTDKFPQSPLIARARYDIGNAYFMEGKYAIAIEALKQVLREHPNSQYAIEAQFLMAQCFEHSGKLDRALALYEEIQPQYPVREVLSIRIDDVKKRIREKK